MTAYLTHKHFRIARLLWRVGVFGQKALTSLSFVLLIKCCLLAHLKFEQNVKHYCLKSRNLSCTSSLAHCSMFVAYFVQNSFLRDSERMFNNQNFRTKSRVGQSVESALISLAAIFWLIARILTIFDKKRILTHRDKRESYLIVLQQNNV